MAVFGKILHPRAIEPSDFDKCVDLVDYHNEFPTGSPERAELFRMWTDIFSSHLGQGVVVEAHVQDHHDQIAIVACAVSMWMKPSFVRQILKSRNMLGTCSVTAGLAQSAMYKQWACLDRKKLKDGVSKRNLNLYIAHLAFDSKNLSDVQQETLSGVMLENLVENHSGYGLHSFMKEVFSADQRDVLREFFHCAEFERKETKSWLMARLKSLKEDETDIPKHQPRRSVGYNAVTPIDPLFAIPDNQVTLSNQGHRDVAFCVSRNKTVKQIAEILGITEEGVNARINEIRLSFLEYGSEREKQILFTDQVRQTDFEIRLAGLLRSNYAQLRPSPYLRAHLWRDAKRPADALSGGPWEDGKATVK